MTIRRVSLKSAADLAGCIPHMLGSHPSACVIALMFGEGRSLCGMVRVDLGEPDRTAWDIVQAVLRVGSGRVTLVAFDDGCQGAQDATGQAEAFCREAGITLEAVYYVRQGRVYGTDLPTGGERVETAVSAVEFTALGSAPVESLDALAELYRPERDIERAALVAQALAGKAGSVVEGVSAWAGILDTSASAPGVESIPAETVADAVAALRAPDTRDAFLAHLLGLALPGGSAEFTQALVCVSEGLRPLRESDVVGISAVISRLRSLVGVIPKAESAAVEFEKLEGCVTCLSVRLR